MASFKNEVVIGREPAVVFAYLADFENVPKWNYAISRTTKLTAGPVRVGSQYEQVRSLPSTATERFGVIALEPPRELAIRGQIGPFDAELRYELEPVSESATELTNRVDLRLRGPLGPLSGVVAGRVGGAVAQNLAVLKRLLEAEA